MIWGFIALIVLAIAFMKLGMYSVWVTILFGGLRVAIAVILLLSIILIWRATFGRK